MESLRFVGNEKRLFIVRFLLDGPMRFNELLRMGMDSKTLSRALKNLEVNGIVAREVLSTQPFSVQYSLTDKGRELKPVIESLRVWAERWVVEKLANKVDQRLDTLVQPIPKHWARTGTLSRNL
ncbi:MAG: winged helix-turn-helix transcriptional regulator [Nitrososphaerales archaeon]